MSDSKDLFNTYRSTDWRMNNEIATLDTYILYFLFFFNSIIYFVLTQTGRTLPVLYALWTTLMEVYLELGCATIVVNKRLKVTAVNDELAELSIQECAVHYVL